MTSAAVRRQEHIDTICLPEESSQPVYGADCFVTGWGKDSFEEGQFQLVLKQVTLPLVDRAACQVGGQGQLGADAGQVT